MHLKIKTLSASAQELYENHGHFHEGDAGLDLFIINQLTIQPGETVLIKSNIACENTDGKPYLLMPRSSISKTPLRQCNSVGLIDAGYRGEIMAAVDNIKKTSFTINPGQRFFQLVSMDGGPISFEIVPELSETARGQGGFGSTGK
ncbi:MAG: dCTP deaminase domain-containing protein [Candidatus Neomarinimicrobiota bacterium]|nr:MAG: dUTP diphosphatase [bacterium]